MTPEEIRQQIEAAIREERVMLFMKGTPDQPRCGFSARVTAILNAHEVEYAAMDILPDPQIRQELSALSNWPTIPQLFINGELVGGCDIVTEMFESGELAEALGVKQPEGAQPGTASAPAPGQPLPLQPRIPG
jgi:monothiol glutaredoxin